MATLPTLVYDGDCAFCTRCVRWMERRLPKQPRVIAWQVADLAALGVTAQEVTDAVQWVEGDAHVGGADGIARLLVWAGGVWSLLGRLMLLPGVIHVARVVYRWIARNRGKMPGGTAACAVPPRDTDTAA